MAGAVLVSLVVLGGFLLTRAETTDPTSYRTRVALSVPSFHPDAGREPPEGVPRAVTRGQTALARAEETKATALEAVGLPADTRGIDFLASINETETMIQLTVTARDPDVSELVAEAYTDAVLQARRQVVVEESNARRVEAVTSIDTLRQRLRAVEGDLRAHGPLPPVRPIPDEDDEDEEAVTPVLVEPTEVALLLIERDLLYRQIARLQSEWGAAAVNVAAPSAHAEKISVAGPDPITSQTQSPLIPAAVILMGGLAVGLGGAVAADRLDHTIRNTKAAARAFAAPVMSAVPSGGRRERHVVLEGTESPRTDAYRTLAATSVATDRLPSAIMVTAPRGDAFDDVAGNFAAALTGLGLKVALVATSPRQRWFLEPFDEPDGVRVPTLPELLAEAHQGSLDGKLCAHLPRATAMPDLVALPPGDEPHLGLPLDGLPPLLEALSQQAEVDVTVIAGPALLEDPNATIVAWATGSVLWACQLGDCIGDDAELAATRLELAGVEPFGVATLGAET